MDKERKFGVMIAAGVGVVAIWVILFYNAFDDSPVSQVSTDGAIVSPGHVASPLEPLAAKSQMDASAQALARAIPDGSPYVFTNALRSEPFSPQIVKKLLDSYNKDLSMHLKSMRKSVSEMPKGNKPGFGLLLSFLEEFEGKLTVEGLDSLGVKASGYGAFYGLGILPVMQIELSNEAVFTQLIERLNSKAGGVLVKKDFNGSPYWSFSKQGDPVEAILAVKDGYLRAAIVPLVDKELLSMVMGEKTPESSILTGDTYKKVLAKYKFKGQGGGYVDLTRILADATNKSEGLNKRVWDSLGLGKSIPPVEPSCVSLAEYMLAQAPRMIGGLTESNKNGYSAQFIFETSPGVGEYLARLAAPVPGIGQDAGSLIDIGFALDADVLKDGIKAAVNDIQERAGSCSMVNNETLTKVKGQLAGLAMIAPHKGIYGAVHDFKMNISAEKIEKLGAGVMVYSDDTMSLVDMASMFNPEVAKLPISVGGGAVEVPLPMAKGKISEKLYVQVTSNALVLALGQDSLGKMVGLANSEPAEPASLMGIGVDMGKLASIINGIVEVLKSDPAKSVMMDDIEHMQRAIGVFSKVMVRVYGAEYGLVFEEKVEM